MKKNYITFFITLALGYSSGFAFDINSAHSSTAAIKVETIADTQDTGTIVYLGKDRFLSAYHVIENAKSIHIPLKNKRYPAQVIAVSIKHDLALLKANIPQMKPVKQSLKVGVGEKVYILSGSGVLLQGHVAKVSANEVLLDKAVPFGTSGGGVFNQNNELIGIISRSDIAQGVTYMTPLSALTDTKERFERKPSIDHNSKHYDYSHCSDPQTLRTWKSVTKDGDTDTQGLHALFLGLCEKVKRREMTTEEANYFFLKIKKQLIGI